MHEVKSTQLIVRDIRIIIEYNEGVNVYRWGVFCDLGELIHFNKFFNSNDEVMSDIHKMEENSKIVEAALKNPITVIEIRAIKEITITARYNVEGLVDWTIIDDKPKAMISSSKEKTVDLNIPKLLEEIRNDSFDKKKYKEEDNIFLGRPFPSIFNGET